MMHLCKLQIPASTRTVAQGRVLAAPAIVQQAIPVLPVKFKVNCWSQDLLAA
jgi:hypothetical protein